MIDRRDALRLLAAGGAGLAAAPLLAQTLTDLRLPGGGGQRPLVTDFPGKGAMILQRTRAPLLETPTEAFDGQLYTPNDRFFVRWHYPDIPLSVDPRSFRLKVVGAVERPIAIPLGALRRLPQVELAAVNQCSGNSRGRFIPRVAGAQWGDGAIGNARWTGVRLKDVLEWAGVRPGAVQVRCSGLDRPPPGAPAFAKSLDLTHAMAGDAMIAWAMNGAELPLLNGYPLRLVVPGWFSTYWVKALDRIELLDAPDAGYWMAKAYRVPATPGADIRPGAKDYPTVPIGRMPPRSFVTNLTEGARVMAGSPWVARGLAMGGDRAVASVELSMDGGRSWAAAPLGEGSGRYGFRLWEATLPALGRGRYLLSVRATNMAGETQSARPTWNPSGYARAAIESVRIDAV